MDQNLPTLKLKNERLARDSTVYTSGDGNRLVETMIEEVRKRQSGLDKYSVDCHVNLKLGVEDPATQLEAGTGRVVACKCFQGTQWSLTIRRGQGDKVPEAAGRSQSKSTFEPSSENSDEYFTA